MNNICFLLNEKLVLSVSEYSLQAPTNLLIDVFRLMFTSVNHRLFM